METDLSPQEQEELTKSSNAFNLDSSTRSLAYKYFLEYKQKTHHINPNQLLLLINCAILCASKSQVVTTIQGKTVRGIGISTTQLTRNMKDNHSHNDRLAPKVNEFVYVLKDFINTVSLDNEVSEDLKKTIDKFAFSYTFFIKYENIFKQLGLRESCSQEEEDYLTRVKHFGWLIYITAKSVILQNRTELMESVILLTLTLGHMLKYMPSTISSSFLEIDNDAIFENSQEKDEGKIYKKLCELLKMTSIDLEQIDEHKKQFQNFLKILMADHIIKGDDEETFEGIYDSRVLSSNFNKLENYYQKNLHHEDMDERFFIHETKAHTPTKFTPFAKQGAANKFAVPSGRSPYSQNKGCSSYRTLNYEVSDKITIHSNLNEIKFANKTIPPSPFTRLLPATPMTKALEMVSWLNERAQAGKSDASLNSRLEELTTRFNINIRESILPKVNTVVNRVIFYEKKLESASKTPVNDKKMKDRYRQAVGLYLEVFEDLILQEEKRMGLAKNFDNFMNESFHKALVAAAIETVHFVNNISHIKFEALLKLCEIQAFDFWRIINSFLKFDPQVPQPVKKHFNDIELRILLHLAWKKDSIVSQVIKSFTSQPKEEQANNKEIMLKTPDLIHSHEMFFKRVLHVTALQVHHLCDHLQLGEEISEKVWTVMKHILGSEISLLIQHHIDQLLLCTVYSICKITNKSIKFQDIIAKYQELPSFNKTDFTETVHQVYLNDTEKVDLIRFYNLVYINQMKPFLFSSNSNHTSTDITSATPMIKKPLITPTIMQSPLKDFLHPNMHFGNSSSNNKMRSPMGSYGLTPPGGISRGFNNSSSDGRTTTNSVGSKRQINFDEGFADDDFLQKKKVFGQKSEGIIEEPLPKNSFKKNLFGGSMDPFEATDDSPKYENMENVFDKNIDFIKFPKNVLAPKGQIPAQPIFTSQKSLKFDTEESNVNGQIGFGQILGLGDGLGMSQDSDKQKGSVTPEFAK